MGDLGEIGKLVLDQVGKTSLTKRDNFFFRISIRFTWIDYNIIKYQQYILDVLVRSLKLLVYYFYYYYNILLL